MTDVAPAGELPDVVVVGRVGVDMVPDGANVALKDVRRFGRAVGGYGGNVSTGLARLGVTPAVIATVGADGHGAFARAFLEGEGVQVGHLRSDDRYRTPLAFFEVWPPDDFPVTFYPTPAYWALADDQLPSELVRSTAALVVSATTLAREPSRTIVLEALTTRSRWPEALRGQTILDLDWRPSLWDEPGSAPALIRRAVGLVNTIIGSESEFAAADLLPAAALALAPTTVFLKRGPRGARALRAGIEVDVAPIEVPTLSGLGAGDAFAAAVVEGLIRRRKPADILRRANAAGAIVAARMTCSDSMPTSTEILELLAKVDVEPAPSTASAATIWT